MPRCTASTLVVSLDMYLLRSALLRTKQLIPQKSSYRNEKLASFPPEAMKNGDVPLCVVVLLRVANPLLINCHWLAANGHSASETLLAAMVMRSC